MFQSLWSPKVVLRIRKAVITLTVLAHMSIFVSQCVNASQLYLSMSSRGQDFACVFHPHDLGLALVDV